MTRKQASRTSADEEGRVLRAMPCRFQFTTSLLAPEPQTVTIPSIRARSAYPLHKPSAEAASDGDGNTIDKPQDNEDLSD